MNEKESPEDAGSACEPDSKKWTERDGGWGSGDETFRQELLRQAEGKFRAHHQAGQRQQSAEEKSGHIVAQKMQGFGR